MKSYVLWLCLLLTPLFSNVGGGRILFLAPIGSKSHKIFFMGIIEALAEKGNHITIVSPYEPSGKIKNVRDVVIQNYTWDTFTNVFDSDETDAFNTNHMMVLFERIPKVCVDGLGQKHIQDLKNERFDLIIISLFFDFCYLSFVHHFKVPFIYISPAGLMGEFNKLISNPDFPSIVGNKLLDLDYPLNFKSRLITTCLNTAFWAKGTFHLYPKIFGLCVERGLCPPDMPAFTEINKNASLMILNSVRTLEYPPRPTMPNVIYAGGAHIKSPKPLPQDLEDWIEESGEDGFIFFSLGSNLTPSLLPEKYRRALINVFGSLKQRVLWKWDQDIMPDLPNNVKLQKWLPQVDILGHSKLRLFITHGGLLSTIESTYRGVPLIGIPVFADQYSNMGEVEREGWGKTILWPSLEEDSFRNLVLEVLNNKTMKQIAQHRSVLISDRLVQPAEEAAYWVEYVMRHKGAAHIMSPIRFMRWYEVYNMDVWALITGLILGILYLSWLLVKMVIHKCCQSSSPQHQKRKRE